MREYHSADLEDVACNLCGDMENPSLFLGRERRFGFGGSFNVVQCQGCGLVRVNPRPIATEMHRYYPADRYFPYRKITRKRGLAQSIRFCVKQMVLAEYKGYPEEWRFRSRFPLGTTLMIKPLRYRFRGVPEYVRGGRLLDVGCGSGNYLFSLRELGWVVFGVEPDSVSARYARDQLGLQVFTGTLEEAAFPDAYFDVVTLRHVLEHLPDPSGSLAEVHRLLKPAGCLMVEVPNIGSLPAAVFRSWWFNLDVPRHLYSFTPQTLERLLKKCGFARVKIEHIADTSGVTGSLQYLWNALTNNPEGNAIRRSRVIHLALLPAAFLLARLGRGEMIRAWAYRGDDATLVD